MTTRSRTDEAVGLIREAFQYWGEVPELSTYTDADHLRSEYEHQSGPTHWFDPATLRFFGSRNRHMVAPGVMVETQMNAPEGVGRYAVVAWAIDHSEARDHRRMGRITPQRLGSFGSLAEARRVARRVAECWEVAR